MSRTNNFNGSKVMFPNGDSSYIPFKQVFLLESFSNVGVETTYELEELFNYPDWAGDTNEKILYIDKNGIGWILKGKYANNKSSIPSAPLTSGTKSTYFYQIGGSGGGGGGGINPINTFANLATFPSTGVIGEVYIALDTDFVYVWDSTTSAYKQVSSISAPRELVKTVTTTTSPTDITITPLTDTFNTSGYWEALKEIRYTGSTITLPALNTGEEYLMETYLHLRIGNSGDKQPYTFKVQFTPEFQNTNNLTANSDSQSSISIDGKDTPSNGDYSVNFVHRFNATTTNLDLKVTLNLPKDYDNKYLLMKPITISEYAISAQIFLVKTADNIANTATPIIL